MERCQKKQKRCEAHEQEEAGDLWDHTAVTADSKLVVSLVVGKRTQEQTRALVYDAKRRLRLGHLPALFTDASDGDAAAILGDFRKRLYYVRVRMPSGSSRSMKPCSLWEGSHGQARCSL